MSEARQAERGEFRSPWMIFLPAALIVSFALGAAGCGDKNASPQVDPDPPKVAPSRTHAITDVRFVGSKSCAECHAGETEEWHGSDHHLAMQKADAKTVLADFGDVTFSHFGIESKFYKKGEEFFVLTPNSEGEPTEYKIDYTFGHYPLQQYLIAFPGGRYQALNICWDSRPADEGGQRWFHLYPDEKIPHDDILHWTRQHFNWNYMCADCHSTDLKKGYDVATNSYKTTWAEMNVGCEACHGPGEAHLAWAASPEDYSGKYSASHGLTVVLKENQEGAWIIDPETFTPRRSKPLESNIQVETCARCHAHRRILETDFHHGQRFADTHRPAILEDNLYHPDGQIDEEVYVYGSFVQSKMFHKGVRCTDCHNPHTLKPKAPGNALCAQCHVATKYDTPAHHHHEVGSTGASCVECHMPEKHYMVVDPRRDHSIRIPRPDLSLKLGTPNACNQCHQDQTAQWAADALSKWLREDGKPAPPAHFGETIAAGRSGGRWAVPRLLDLVGNSEEPAIARATALSLLARQPSQEGIAATIAALDDPSATVREAALTGLEPMDAGQRMEFATRLLDDPVRSVRIEAARLLAPAHAALRAGAYGPAFDAALEEYKQSLDAVADRPGSHMGYGLLYSDLGDAAQAEKAYRTAFKVDPAHIESRINLADLLGGLGRDAEATQLYEECVRIAPERGVAHEAFGRFLVRQRQYDRALLSIAEAARLMPENPQIQHFYGVALNQLGQFEKSLVPLQKAHDLAPENAQYLSDLVAICRDGRRWDLALEFARKLVDLNPAYGELYRSIEAQSRADGGR